MPSMTFLLPDGSAVRVEAPAGTTLLEAARLAHVEVEGACGGSMACATCHVHVADDWFDRLRPAAPEEEDMLDLASELATTSRLGCQIRLTSELDGLVVSVPRTTLLT
ncbi:MAG: 2Fe-2S iron-sulfur cluster-binding protein [Geminicoccaceae bacterium]